LGDVNSTKLDDSSGIIQYNNHHPTTSYRHKARTANSDDNVSIL